VYTSEHATQKEVFFMGVSTTTMTIRLEPKVKKLLDSLAKSTHRSKSFLAAEAIREYLILNEWQVQEIRDAITEADAGDFASAAEVAAAFKKWGTDAG
jgi:RHH-type transcriptional regulator, rel operon repressor / antitoxin RelB